MGHLNSSNPGENAGGRGQPRGQTAGQHGSGEKEAGDVLSRQTCHASMPALSRPDALVFQGPIEISGRARCNGTLQRYLEKGWFAKESVHCDEIEHRGDDVADARYAGGLGL